MESEMNSPSIGVGSQQPNRQACIDWLKSQGLPMEGPPEEEDQWCPFTFDGLMCWSSVRNGSKAQAYCPDVPGLDTTKLLTKYCHTSGRWRGFNDTDFSKQSGYTPFVQDCLLIPRSVMKDAKILASRARRLEYVGLACSFCALAVAVFIFSYFRRLRVFRTQLHLNLMVALLVVVCVRLCLYLDQGLDWRDASAINGTRGLIIHPTVVVCEMSYVALEYFKTVTFAWMFLEGFYLWNSIVMTVFQKEPKIWQYMAVGWGGSLAHTSIWLVAVVMNPNGVNGCLRNYFLHPTFWILDGPRMIGLVLNTLFIISVVWVLWMKVKETSSSSEVARMKKSVKAAFMLIPLLGIPNVTQVIPFKPTEEYFTVFAVYTYVASFFYMFQGFMIAIIYCFTNREVMSVLTGVYERYKLTHSTAENLRRGSRMQSQKSRMWNDGGSSMRMRVSDAPTIAKAKHDALNTVRISNCATEPRLNTPTHGSMAAAAQHQHLLSGDSSESRTSDRKLILKSQSEDCYNEGLQLTSACSELNTSADVSCLEKDPNEESSNKIDNNNEPPLKIQELKLGPKPVDILEIRDDTTPIRELSTSDCNGHLDIPGLPYVDSSPQQPRWARIL